MRGEVKEVKEVERRKEKHVATLYLIGILEFYL